MSLIQRIMGRRQFLIAAGVTSTCALTCKKLAGFIDRSFQTSAASAAERGAAGLKTSANRCPHLLSPLRIRNVVLKNRIMHTTSPPHSLQGPENYPTDAFRNHFSNMAKNAAIVTLKDHFGTYPKTYGSGRGTEHYSDNMWEDIPPVHNYINRMIDDIHCEGALVLHMAGGGGMPAGGGGTAPGGGDGRGAAAGASGGGMPGGAAGGMPGGGEGGGMAGSEGGRGMAGGEGGRGMAANAAEGGMPGREGGRGAAPGAAGRGNTQAQGPANTEDIVAQAKEAESQGYDVYMMNTNSLEAVQAVRAATNLVLLSQLRVGGGGMGRDTSILHKWDYELDNLDWQFGQKTPGINNRNHPTDDELEQAVESAKQMEGLVDILWIRDGRHEHPNCFTQDEDRPFNLYYAEAIKKAGVDVLLCPSAGFHNVANNDRFIASGMTDMVGMTTPFFADPQLVKKASEGRLDDIVPCIQCHNCHSISRTHGPWYDTCTVSPEWATPMYKLKNIPAPTATKKVAVIGGGPGGMKAALVAAERGHKVTLYEKDAALGGLLQFTDHSQWKWNYRVFKDYLINQVKKAGIDVELKTAATHEMIKAKGYDTVLVATGAEPVIPRMRGADSGNVFNILTAYSNKKALGKNVVMIGAGRIGTEAAIGMAKDGHNVMILTSGKDLMELEFIGSHNLMNQIGILQNHPDLNFDLEVTVKSITGGKVMYTDSKGEEKSVKADSVVVYSGLKPMVDEAEKFFGSADQVLFLGHCTGKNNTIQKTIRSAFFMASQI